MSDLQDTLTNQRIRTTCLVILTVIAVGAALVPLRPVLVPLLLALLFTYCLKPIIGMQTRRGLPRWLAVGVALLVALALLTGMGLIVITFVGELQDHLPDYQIRFRSFNRQLAAAIPLKQLGLPIDPEGALTMPAESMRLLLTGAASSAADVLSGSGLVLIFVVFFLVGGPVQRRSGTLMSEIEVRAQSYVLQTVGFSVLTGALVGVALAAFGVDFAFAFGFLTFLLNFIPTIGPLVATLLPVPVVMLDPEKSLAIKVMALGLPALIQLTLGVVQPRVQGGAQNLHPVTTMAALVFFGSIWGVLGAALAVPLTGVIRIVLERIPTTRPVAGWMAGQFDPADEATAPPEI